MSELKIAERKNLDFSARPLLSKISLLGLLLSFFCVLFFPMMTDEAYYMDWTEREFSTGYFDHPPFVAWQGVLSHIHPSIQFARFGVFISAIGTFLITWKIGFVIWSNQTKALLAAILFQLTLGGLANSFLLTPDSGLAFFWALALHESLIALSKDKRRWLTAGIATGLGLQSKYTMMLIGPVFLIGLILENPRQLKTMWPYLGGCLAALFFSSNLLWNSNHGWTTFRFQFGHGFSVNQSIDLGSSLPTTDKSDENMAGHLLYQELDRAMNSQSGFEETKKLAHPKKQFFEQAWMYLGDYLGGVAGLWGGILFPLIFTILKLRSKILFIFSRNNSHTGIRFMAISALWPLIFFLVLSPFSKIEANWSAMHLIPAAVVLAGYLLPSMKIILPVFVFNSVISLILIGMARFPHHSPFGRENRLLSEASGYDHLAEVVQRSFQNQVVAVDSYQLKSAFSARIPSLRTVQWPGITRPSQYTMGTPEDRAAEQSILAQSEFTLVSSESTPPFIPGYLPYKLQGIRTCSNGTIGIYDAQNPQLPCERGLKDWWLAFYKRI